MKNKLLKLEGVRGFAALYVFANHLLTGRILVKGSWLYTVSDLGFEVVMLFFLLSGFVIFYSQSRHRDQTFSGYFGRRFKRIYPIYIFALAATYVANCLSAGMLLRLDVGNLLGNLCMWQDTLGFKPGVHIDAFGGNISLWSLSYEWWFYLMFWPIYRYVPPGVQLLLVAGLSAGGGLLYLWWPNQASLFLLYFIIWWCGVELARTYSAGILPGLRNQAWVVGVLGLFCLALAGARTMHPAQAMFLGHPVLRQFCSSWLFLASALAWAGWKFRGFDFIPYCFSWAAPISYAVYALHYPLAVTATYLSFIPFKSLQITGYILMVFAAAYFGEFVLQKMVNRSGPDKGRSPAGS